MGLSCSSTPSLILSGLGPPTPNRRAAAAAAAWCASARPTLMDRNVPRTGSEEIELYVRTYYSLLRSSEDVQIKTLVEAHAQMESLLHPHARDDTPDMSAFLYSLLRLPEQIGAVRLVILGQSRDVFERHGVMLDDGWAKAPSRARRRR